MYTGGFPLATMFQLTNCRFIGNKVVSKEINKHFYFRSGTVMITALPVKFSGETIFADNVGTALHVVAARVTFDNHTHVTFENNNGDKGGALALVGMATLIFNSSSTFLFVNNHADFVGGAIYWYYTLLINTTIFPLILAFSRKNIIQPTMYLLN